MEILGVLTIVVLYSLVWFVPLAINIQRRKKGKPAFWLLFLSALIVEIGLIYAFLCIFKNNYWSVFLAPVLASIIAGYFYYLYANRLDEKDS